jgi:hypothetical protein
LLLLTYREKLAVAKTPVAMKVAIIRMDSQSVYYLWIFINVLRATVLFKKYGVD